MEESKSSIVDNKLFFAGKMNLDLTPELQKNGEYGAALNINPVNYSGGFVGTLTNVTGNEEVNYTFTGLTANPFIKVVGSKLDEKRRRVYYLIYAQNAGSDQYAYIVYYSYDTQDITTVFSSSNLLEFDPNFTISDVNIIYDDELGDTLMWVDRNTEPKRYNVTAGDNRFNNYTAATTGFTVGDIVFANGDESISAIRQFIPCRALTTTNDYPAIDYTTGELDTVDWETLPVGQCYPPFLVDTLFYQKVPSPYWSPNGTFRYDDGTEEVEGVATFLRRKSYQFAYAYIYFDGSLSEVSPFSESVLSQELTSAIFTIGEVTANPDYPTPSGIDVKVPIHSFRYTDVDDVASVTEFPHVMIARVKLLIREVPTDRTPTDWLEWLDIPYDELYKYNLSSSNISEGFPVAGDAGTYYYDWFSGSYSSAPSGETSQITTITARYDGTQTLIPVDVKWASTNSYASPKKANSQDISENRTVMGGTTDGMNVSRDVVSSISDNISLDLFTQTPNISVNPTQTEINKYNTSTTSQSYNSGTGLYTGVFDLQVPLVIVNFDILFQVDFTLEWKTIQSGTVTSITLYNIQTSVSGIPDEFATYKEFLESTINDQTPFTAIVDDATGELTITRVFSSTFSNAYDVDIVSNVGFFSVDTYLPFRTYKNHSTQQFGFVFRDELGRPTPVITGDWATLYIPHFINQTNQPQIYGGWIKGISNFTTPPEARVMDIVRKRSESFQNFIQFALSSSNTVQENWNWDRPYVIGFENLEIDDSVPSVIPSNKNLYISLNSVNGGDGNAYNSLFDSDILSFLPQEGDVLRFLYRTDQDGIIIEEYNASFNISKYDDRTNTIVINFEDLEENEPDLAAYLEGFITVSFEWTVRVLCEVIQKPTQSDNEFYWETSAQLSCTDGAVDIDGTAFQGNITIFGDTYLKLRGYCVTYNSENPAISFFINFVLQDLNFNDFAPTWNTGQGRPNKQVRSLRRGQNEYVEVTRDNLLRYSEQSIQNTDIRRYNLFYDENIQEVDNVYGRIEKIDADGDVLNIYQEDKMSRVLVGRSVTTELSGDQRIIASQNNVFSDVIYNSFSGGISIDGDSFTKSGYQKYFTDSKRGKVYRQSMDGVTPISEVGMSGYFKDIFRKVRNSFTTPVVRGIVDERTDEYILSITYSEAVDVEVVSANSGIFTFQKPDSAVGFITFGEGQLILIDPSALTTKYSPSELAIAENETAAGVITVSQNPLDLLVPGDIVRASIPKNETLVYSERTKGWTTFLGYTAEWLESGIQSYHTFFNGEMWFHDLGNTDYNTFFGTLQDSSVVVYGNKAPELTKYWRNISAKTKAQNIEIGEGGITTSEEQVSHLPATMFENREGSQHAPFLGEGTGTNVNIGDKLRGRWVKTLITLPSDAEDNQEFKLFGVAFISGESGLTY
jgi:hypothetical protein